MEIMHRCRQPTARPKQNGCLYKKRSCIYFITIEFSQTKKIKRHRYAAEQLRQKCVSCLCRLLTHCTHNSFHFYRKLQRTNFTECLFTDNRITRFLFYSLQTPNYFKYIETFILWSQIYSEFYILRL